jgi:uracil-DNA glycosylase family 4
MTDVRNQLADHLRFYADLGVTGVSTDERWRARGVSSSQLPASSGETPGATPKPSILDPRSSTLPPSPAEPAADFPPSPLRGFGGAGGEASESVIRVSRSAAEALAAIKTDIGPDCPRCKLATLGRKQVVFGVGNPNADLMFVGEAPGGDEDIQGIPFVGRAGQLLTRMIVAINLDRDQVYIANLIKCRPPGNRNPEPDEIETCEPFLFQQIDAVQPRVIVALGAFAAKTLLGTQESISRLRGRVFDYRGAKLIPTFHPSFLLRSPDRKREAWEDLKKARALLTGPVTGDE